MIVSAAHTKPSRQIPIVLLASAATHSILFSKFARDPATDKRRGFEVLPPARDLPVAAVVAPASE